MIPHIVYIVSPYRCDPTISVVINFTSFHSCNLVTAAVEKIIASHFEVCHRYTFIGVVLAVWSITLEVSSSLH